MAQSEKLHDADREARRILSLQTNENTPSARRLDTALTALFAAAIALIAVLFWALPDRTLSETENRALAPFPEISGQTLADGSFTADIAEYMADQFPGRDAFIMIRAAAETALGKGTNNGVFFGRDGYLIARDDFPNRENIKTNLHAIGAFSVWCGAREIPVLTAVTGRNADVLPHMLPTWYGSTYSDRIWTYLEESAGAEGVALLNLRDPLRERAENGEYVYYRTDHHWTTLGAYYGYCAIMESMGETPYPLSDFERRTVSLSFTGTSWSTAGAFWMGGDEMEFFRFAGDGDFTTTVVDDGTSFGGFYDESYLTKKDKYSAFLSGNHGLVTVQAKDPDDARQTLLVVKDSFAHAAAPFLARHYDLVIVDLRYYRQAPAALVDEYGVDRVLVLYNLDSLSTSATSRMLEAGLDNPG